MKTKLLILSTLSVYVFASGDISYNLDYYGDSISKKMLKHNHISSAGDISKIQRVLDLNNITWDDAKKLPIGYEFYVYKAPKKFKVNNTPMAKNSYKKNYGIEVGTFHHTQDQSGTSVYSDLSQYVKASMSVGTYYGSLRLNRYAYSADSEQNISEDNTSVLHEASVGKKFSFNRINVNAGLFNESLFLSDTTSLNAIDFSSVNATGTQGDINTSFEFKRGRNLFTGLNLKYALIGIDAYSAVKPYVGTKFKYNKTNLALILEYTQSVLEDGANTVKEKLASLGIKAIF
ncbi:MAG: hypothetical protein N4A33_00075 [Bacteriovoracaceae bacterium]|jgi:hypothetical protein|nr:hypothetical protein [Bacteriovoracaceae bacterium]